VAVAIHTNVFLHYDSFRFCGRRAGSSARQATRRALPIFGPACFFVRLVRFVFNSLICGKLNVYGTSSALDGNARLPPVGA